MTCAECGAEIDERRGLHWTVNGADYCSWRCYAADQLEDDGPVPQDDLDEE